MELIVYISKIRTPGGTIFLTKHLIEEMLLIPNYFDAIENGGVRLYYDGNSKLKPQMVVESFVVILSVTEDLQVMIILPYDNANFAGNTVQISSNSVKASRFEGRADEIIKS